MKPKRRYLQFSLGTMFLAVTALCIWLGVQVKWMRDRQEAREWLQAHGCIFGSGYNGNDPFTEKPAVEIAAPWPIRAFGEAGIRYIFVKPEAMLAGKSTIAPTVEHMKGLFPEADVIVPLAPP